MCGINGFITLNNNYHSLAQQEWMNKLQVMNNTIAHRGPDAEGTFLREPVGLGFRRLSIIDLREKANQPMFDNNKEIVLIFNGEIYNYIEIRETLKAKGYQFRTESDTEVIINSYLEYGDQCVEHFNGMWAFVLFDFRKNRLFCSRDRMGVKPFYYSLQDDCLFFSSELKALHAVCDLRKANLQRVYQYLAYGYRLNDGNTFLEDCMELLPGTNLICENQEVRLQKYWTLKENRFQQNGQKGYKEAFVDLFESAVKLRYRSDVPVALLLSGGLDSTSIAKVTDNLIESGDLPQNDIHAFIASFPNYKDDETPIAREFVKTCKHIQLHEIQINSQNIVDNFEQLIYSLDHPLFSFTSIAHNNIMRACKAQNIKVVINGQGSDEALAGYDSTIAGAYLLDQLLAKKGHFIKEFQSLNHQNGFSKPFLLTQIAKSFLSPSFASFLRAKYQENSIARLDENFVAQFNQYYKSGYAFSLKGNNLNSYLLDKINHQGLNSILHYEDISSMNQSIEIRSPFLDYRLMEFAFSIPVDLKLKNGRTKIILRDTIGKMLPESITKNRKKIGFNTPFVDYIARDTNFKGYLSDLLASQHFKNKHIWDAKKISTVFEKPEKHVRFPFWRVINLEVWSKVYGINNL